MVATIFNKSAKHYKKVFKKHTDKLYKTFQTKPIELKDESYVLFGQSLLKYTPLISHFDVFNEQLRSADDSTAKTVHDFIQKLYITDEGVKLLHRDLTKLSGSRMHSNRIVEQFELEEDTEAMILADSVDENLMLMDQLFETTESMKQKEQWTEQDIVEVNGVWEQFWSVYQKRAQALLSLYRHNKKLGNRSEDEPWIKPLHNEAKGLYNRYKSLSSMGETVGASSIDDLISHNYIHGRLTNATEPRQKNDTSKRAVYLLVAIAFYLFIFIIVPTFIISLFAIKRFNIFTLIPLLIASGLALAIKQQHKHRIIMQNTKDLAKVRAVKKEETIR